MNSTGSVTELFKAQCAAIILMDYDDEQTPRFLRLGEFVINLIMQAISPILMIVCMVEGFQWPITKDAPIIRIGLRTFAFAMPGLVYGVQFRTDCTEETMDTLQRIFLKFANFKDLNERETGYPWLDNEPNFWMKLRPQIEQIANVTLARFGHMPGRSPSAVGNQESGLLKALRTSATTKLVCSTIISCSLKPMHIEIYGTRLRNLKIYSKQAFVSISVVTNIVEALEFAWVLALGNTHLLRLRRVGLGEPTGCLMCKLSEKGIGFFLEELMRDRELDEENVIRNVQEGEGSSKERDGGGQWWQA